MSQVGRHGLTSLCSARAERTGVSKSPQWIDYAQLEQALRDDLETRAPRAVAVLKPIRLVLDNWPADLTEEVHAPVHPHQPELGNCTIRLGRELWIEADDFMEHAPADYFRLSLGPAGSPGQPVRLRYGYVIRATSALKNSAGEVVEVHAEYLPQTKSGTPGASSVKTKAAIHWLPVADGIPAEVRVYDQLFTDAHPDAGDDFLSVINRTSKHVLRAYVETLPRPRKARRQVSVRKKRLFRRGSQGSLARHAGVQPGGFAQRVAGLEQVNSVRA